MYHVLAQAPTATPAVSLTTLLWQPAAVVIAALIAACVGQWIAHSLHDKRERIKAVRESYAAFAASAFKYLLRTQDFVLHQVNVNRVRALAERSETEQEAQIGIKHIDSAMVAMTESQGTLQDAQVELYGSMCRLITHLRFDKDREEVNELFQELISLRVIPGETPEQTHVKLAQASPPMRTRLLAWVMKRQAR